VKVVIGARDRTKGSRAAALLVSEGLDVAYVEMDVDSRASVSQAMAEIASTHGTIDILINNAGVLLDGPHAQQASILDLEPDRLLASFCTNTAGALLTMQAVLPAMRHQNYGRIVNISSRAGQLEELRAGVPSYRISKTALNSLTRVAAAEFKDDNIKINAMCPGWVRTDMGGANAPLSPIEGADTAVWLSSLPADGPTGGFFRQRAPLPW
jgi:NAD(P)-dependent dehydrogenase (short-subunit alcohol dehydrogenase family)